MNIYKLNYINKETAIADLKAKGIMLEEGYGIGVHAIVEIGIICINEQTEEILPIFAEGYHYDVMCEQEIDFGENEIQVNHPKHSFAGYEQNTDSPVLEV